MFPCVATPNGETMTDNLSKRHIFLALFSAALLLLQLMFFFGRGWAQLLWWDACFYLVNTKDQISKTKNWRLVLLIENDLSAEGFFQLQNVVLSAVLAFSWQPTSGPPIDKSLVSCHLYTLLKNRPIWRFICSHILAWDPWSLESASLCRSELGDTPATCIDPWICGVIIWATFGGF